jgi:tetracycline 7-halogenase / FADH2 O2-dependent halogenase
VGDRWCLMGHAAGAVDALFSRGMFHTTGTVHAVADQVLEALKDDNFSRARFQHIEDVVQTGLAYNDRTVACSYAAFRNFDLWNAWYRVYGIGAFLEAMRLTRAHLKYAETGDREYLRVLHHTPFRTLGGGIEGWNVLFHEACELVESCEADRISPEEAARGIYALFKKADFIPPMMELTSPSRRFLSDTSKPAILKFVVWGKTSAPKLMKEKFFDVSVATLLSEHVKWGQRNLRRKPPRAYAG